MRIELKDFTYLLQSHQHALFSCGSLEVATGKFTKQGQASKAVELDIMVCLAEATQLACYKHRDCQSLQVLQPALDS
jgi:hypothetical protein